MSLYKELKSAIKEEDVNRIYKNFFAIGALLAHSKIKVDGLVRIEEFLVLLEFKYNKDFTKRSSMIEVIIQVLYYLKQFESIGEELPSICFVGDINECFYFHSNLIIDYLSLDIDWTIAPSNAGKKNTDLFSLLYKDGNINPYIHVLNEGFKLNILVEEIIKLNNSTVQKRHITEKNVNRIFTYFIERIIRGKKLNKRTANELVGIFITTILNKDQNYIHPHKPNTLVTKDFGNVIVNGNVFTPFFERYQMDFSVKEKARLTEICDRLIEDTTRRFQGEFFTPTEWVDEAHKMIEPVFGEDWKERYVVWDPACGTGNLTRDYKFKELYCSTLNQSDLDIMDQMGYNLEAIKFQFNFLNDSEDKLSSGLKKALEDKKPIIVLANPPYGTANNISTDTTIKRRIGMANTVCNKDMKKFGFGASAQQLYTQFFYNLYRLKLKYKCVINICFYTMPIFLSGPAFKKFRNIFFREFRLINGMSFNASYFDDTSSLWGILFTIIENKEFEEQNTMEFKMKVMDIKKGKVVQTGNKTIYNLDNKLPASKWVRGWLKGIGAYDVPQLSSAIKIKQSGCCKLVKNALGYMHNNGNSIYHNGQFVGLYSSAFAAAHGLSVTKWNFDRTTALFTARRCIKRTWLNGQDEYMAPNMEHPDYKQWNNDCIIYSLFNNKSNQSSMRNITYKEKQWDIINEWFWCPKEYVQELAEHYKVNEVEQDIKNFGRERFVHHKLNEINLSEDAKQILQQAIKLVTDSFEYRKIMIEEYPEHHLNTWDAGWYQIKKILTSYMPDELKVFRKMYKEFEDRMREGVYLFGFLRE